MTELTPLISQTADEEERWMLEAARAERSRPCAEDQLIDVLLRTRQVEPTSDPVAESSPSALLATTRRSVDDESPSWLAGALTTVRQGFAVLLRKPAWAALAVGLVLGAAGGSLVTARLSDGRDAIFIPVQGEVLHPPAAAAPGPSTQACPQVAPAAGEEHDEETGKARRVTGQRANGTRGKSTSAAASIAEEVGLLDAAREALARGDSNDALQVLNTHAERFGAGALVQEAEVLRIQALIEAGDRSEATAKAKHYLTEHADSPHANRVRAWMNQAKRDELRRDSSKASSKSPPEESKSP